MTVSNLVGPLLLFLGRFFIAAMISAEAVAYFVTPYEVVSKLLIIPAVLVSVLFPEISRLGSDNSPRIRQLYRTSMRGLGLVMAILCALVYLLAETGLTLWIDAGFAVNSYRVAQILAVDLGHVHRRDDDAVVFDLAIHVLIIGEHWPWGVCRGAGPAAGGGACRREGGQKQQQEHQRAAIGCACYSGVEQGNSP